MIATTMGDHDHDLENQARIRELWSTAKGRGWITFHQVHRDHTMFRVHALDKHLAAAVLAFPQITSAADPADGFQPTHVSAHLDRKRGLQAFAQIERVILHPRCVNCHASVTGSRK